MSVMVTLPPQMEKDVREYVTQDDAELARLLIVYLKKELEQRRQTRQKRSLAPDPALYCKVNCDLFEDTSSDWESANGESHRGCLIGAAAAYADPTRRRLEKSAFRRAMEEKHASAR